MAPFIVVDSLTYSDGYHTFYLVYKHNDYVNIHPTPLSLHVDDNMLVADMAQPDKFEKNLCNDDIVFGIYRHIISKTSSEAVDTESIERSLNSVDSVRNPNIIDIFTYDAKDIDILGDDATIIVTGIKAGSSKLIVKTKKTINSNGVEQFKITDPSFSLKLK